MTIPQLCHLLYNFHKLLCSIAHGSVGKFSVRHGVENYCKMGDEGTDSVSIQSTENLKSVTSQHRTRGKELFEHHVFQVSPATQSIVLWPQFCHNFNFCDPQPDLIYNQLNRTIQFSIILKHHMSHPSNRPYPGKVRFETPMKTDESAYSSVAGTPPVNVSGPHELIFPTSVMDHTNSESGFNLGMSLPATQPPPAPRFNFGMDLDMPAAPSATPPTPRFNLGMNLSIPGAVLPASPALHTQQPFNLGFTLPQPAQQPAPKPFNLGFNLPVPSNATPPPTTPSQPFNFGFNLPFATPLATSSVPVPAQEDTLRNTLPQPTQQPASKPFNLGFNLSVQSKGTPLPTTSSQPFNFGLNLPRATPLATHSEPVLDQAETSRHVGYDINNRCK